MGFSRALWVQLGSNAAQGRDAWRASSGGGRVERALWLAATVLMAIPIFALLVLALLGAAALTIAAVVVAWLWGSLVRLGIIRPRNQVTEIRVSPPRSIS